VSATIDRSIIGLAIPATLTVGAEPLYELTDVAILGRVGTSQLAGAALGGAVLVTTYGIFIFLLFGTTAAVARLVGADRLREAAERGVQAIWVGLALGLALAAVGTVAAEPLIGLLSDDGRVAEAALVYLRISLIGLPAFFIAMAGAGYLRGRGDTKTPLWISLWGVGLNLAIEIVLIFGLGFGVAGSALGTVIGKWAAAAVFAALVARSARSHGALLRPDRRQMLTTTTTGLPLMVRTAALRVAVGGAAVAAGRLGEAELAAYAIAFQIWAFLAYVGDGLEVSGQVLVAEALGRRDPERARLVGDRILRFGLLGGVIVGACLLVLHRLLPGAFTGDEEVRRLVATSLVWVAAMQPVNLLTFSLDGILVGAADLWFLAGAMVGAAIVFVTLAWLVVARGLSLGALWAAVAAFMAMRLGVLGVRYVRNSWLTPTR
jgi:putative MATE family efflux protein